MLSTKVEIGYIDLAQVQPQARRTSTKVEIGYIDLARRLTTKHYDLQK